jgi:predicted dehydrogenase
MVHDLDEGPLVIESQTASGKTFQVGSQGMSSLGNEKARELLLDGAIGELNYAEGFWARNSPTGAWQYQIPEDASPENVDWETFLRDGPDRRWDPVRFFRWRNYRDYGTGVSGDLFVHLFSSLHFITGSMGPDRIYASGGLRFWEDGREVPDVMLGVFDYPETEQHPGFNLSLRVNFVDGTSGTTYLRLVGSEGAMDVEWRKVTLYKNKKQAAKDPFLMGKMAEVGGGYDRAEMLPPPKVIYEVEEAYKGAHFDHFYNFFQGVRNGEPVAEDAVFGYRAAAPALACNQSYFEDRIVRWDPENMNIAD